MQKSCERIRRHEDPNADDEVQDNADQQNESIPSESVHVELRLEGRLERDCIVMTVTAECQ
jgi:hypothetical protein